ncbi:hypothetical protein [Aridibaculum aurantiacum]|uniref:hypothetical protein n=1 Tax=Aridibaculum aurantiacum TaxID=2810307 RepID=UPI001A96EED4|nr:hypothetical protein [Aridibaculum aurantiacum]
MSNKNEKHSGNVGLDGTVTNNKGESQQNPQKGAMGVSKKDTGKRTKDESHGAKEYVEKKQPNSI